MTEAADDFTEELFSTTEYVASEPPKREFKPWHRPRKQYVRQQQWCTSIEAMAASWDLTSGPLKYLTLPGPDLLDINLIHDNICNALGVNLRFLGFDTSADPLNPDQTNLNIALHEAKHLARINEGSSVLPDDILWAGKPESFAYREVSKAGPYHVINLDFCDGFVQNPIHPQNLPTTYDLISSLFDLQARSDGPSLLFLTTRSNRASNDPSAISTMFNVALDQYRSCEPFKFALEKNIGVSSEQQFAGLLEDEEHFETGFLIGMFTYMLSVAHSKGLELKLEDVACYKVYPESPVSDMASIVFALNPVRNTQPDPHGLGNNQFLNRIRSKCQLVKMIVVPTVRRTDIDELMASDIELRSVMVSGTEKLLRRARYSIEDYRTWVANQP